MIPNQDLIHTQSVFNYHCAKTVSSKLVYEIFRLIVLASWIFTFYKFNPFLNVFIQVYITRYTLWTYLSSDWYGLVFLKFKVYKLLDCSEKSKYIYPYNKIVLDQPVKTRLLFFKLFSIATLWYVYRTAQSINPL